MLILLTSIAIASIFFFGGGAAYIKTNNKVYFAIGSVLYLIIIAVGLTASVITIFN